MFGIKCPKKVECPKFGGEDFEAEKGNRATCYYLPPRMESQFWAGHNVIYMHEKERIEEWLKREADSLIQSAKDENKELTEDQIKEKWQNIYTILKKYKEKDKDYVETLKGALGKFEEDNRTKSFNLGPIFTVLFFISVILEFVVLIFQTVAMSLAEGAEYIDFTSIGVAGFYAALLAIGGFLFGKSLGALFVHLSFKNKGLLSGKTKDFFGLLDSLFMIIGIVLISFVAIVRFLAGGGPQALAVTVILGLVVAAFEAAVEYYGTYRCFIGNLREKAFILKASDMHDLNQYQSFFFSYIKDKTKISKTSLEGNT